jgi:cytochrome c553
VRVRVVEGFSSEGVPGVTMFGLTMDEGAAVLGEATVHGDGSWLADVPPYIPIHLQPIDKFGLAIRNQRLWIQAMPGESRVCGGCHESRTGNNSLGINQNPTLAGSRGPENLVTPVADRIEYPWLMPQNAAAVPGLAVTERFPQELLTAKCAGCHNATVNGNKPQEFYTLTRTDTLTGTMTSYQIPRLDLTAAPITVVYDRRVNSWAASYVSIFYPATLGMMQNTEIVGVPPPNWGVPESARQSVLIEKLNIKAADGTYAWPVATHPPHPEDVGVTLTDSERQMLIRVMDLGGPYYARQGGQFIPNPTDPTAASK